MTDKRKINVRLKELRDADVSFVSLVDRSASRIPFRVMKADKEHQMGIDLGSLKNVVKREKAVKSNAPVVSGIVVENKSPTYLDRVKVALSASGFEIGNAIKNDDGTVLFAQVAKPLENAHLVRVSDATIVVMKGFDSASETLSENADFSSSVAVEGYFPGVSVATAGLRAAVNRALKSDGGGEQVKQLIAKFSAYTGELAASVPAAVFKADVAIKGISSDQVPTAAPNGVSQEDWDAMSDDDKVSWAEDSVTKGDLTDIESLFNNLPSGNQFANASIAGKPWASMSTVDKVTWLLQSYTKSNTAGAQDDQDGGAGGAVRDGASLSVTKSDKSKAKKGEDGDSASDTSGGDDGNDSTSLLGKPAGISNDDWAAMSPSEKIAARTDVAKKETISVVTEAMAPVMEALKAMTAKMESQQHVIDEVVRKSEAAMKAVKGTVVASAVSGDNFSGTVQETKVVKSEEDPRTGTFDTAFLRKRR